jgi:rhomboid protease GluP
MDQNPPEQPKRKSIFWSLVPTREYFFTPIIININILVYVAMVISGVDPMFPDSNALIKWGANMRSLTMGGEWWRMFTSMFLHYGILHLAFNMFALYSIGKSLEPFIGRWRFLILYLCSGIGGSVVSLWWHDAAAGAGASGAIFGTFGIFAALLTTDLIDKSVRMPMLKSMAYAIGLNLLIGLSGNIDNSAHIGGLLTGAIGGYLSYFDLKAWFYRRKKQITFLLLTVLITIGITATFWIITPPSINVDGLYKEMVEETNAAIGSYAQNKFSTNPNQIRKEQIAKWEKCSLIGDTLLKSKDITSEGKNEIRDLKKYAETMTTAAQYWYRAVTEKDSSFVDSARPFEKQATELMMKMNERGGK